MPDPSNYRLPGQLGPVCAAGKALTFGEAIVLDGEYLCLDAYIEKTGAAPSTEEKKFKHWISIDTISALSSSAVFVFELLCPEDGVGSRFVSLDTTLATSASDLDSSRLRNREWMFIQWGDKPVDRHRGYIGRLIAFVPSAEGSTFFTHSTAYYRKPWNVKWQTKIGWGRI